MMRCWLVDATPPRRPPSGNSFDGEGHGVFRRGTYTVTFSLEHPEPGYVDVNVDRADGLTVIARVVEKTGWQIVDPLGPTLIDLAASRAAGQFVHKGDSHKAGPVKAARNWRVPAFACAGLTAVAVVGWLVVSAGLRRRRDHKRPRSAASRIGS